jgi:hypothetical protein
MPKNKNHLLFARARACDWHHAIEPDKDKMLIPSSTIQAEWKRKSGNKQKSAGKLASSAACAFGLCWF